MTQMTVFLFFSFYLKLRCLKSWKAFLASLPKKRLNHFPVFSLGSTTQRKSLDCEENPVHWELENCSALTRFPGGISSQHEPCWSDPSSHYAVSERLLASLGVLDYENPGRGMILQQGLQGEQVTGLMWGKCQNTPGFIKDFKCETEAGKKKRFYSRLTMSPLQILKFWICFD